MKTLSYVGSKSLAKLFGIFGVFYGLIMGLFLTVFSSVGSSITGASLPGLGILSIVVTPVLYGAMGYVSGYVSANIYNKMIVPKFGGIEIELN